MTNKQTGIVWFRNDLRTHDQQALFESTRECTRIIPVYIFDPRTFKQGHISLSRTGPKRLVFLIETLMQLRKKLQLLGSDLVIKFGLPEHVLPNMAKQYGAKAIYFNHEPAPYEQMEEQSLVRMLRGVSVHVYDSGFLIPCNYLPFEVNSMPDIFTEFRKAIERACNIPKPIDDIQYMPPLPGDMETGDFARLSLYLPDSNYLQFRDIVLKGGEQAGLERVRHYIWDSWAIAHYYDTRNELEGPDNASGLSAWLANGSISPRYLYHQVKRFESECMVNRSTYWLIFELLWREFFRYSMLKYGKKYFRAGGIIGKKMHSNTTLSLHTHSLSSWISGTTGNDLVDAMMKELSVTGLLSNRSRQIVASYLVYDMGLDWLGGAGYFEHVLIDYDVCSNYGNWAYIAGVGCDPRNGRHFDVRKQASMYDADGTYRAKWLNRKTI